MRHRHPLTGLGHMPNEKSGSYGPLQAREPGSATAAGVVAFLEKRSPALVGALACTLLAAVASLNYHLDSTLSFLPLYLIPILVVALYANRRMTFLFCLITAGAVFIVERFAINSYPGEMTIAWNTCIDLGLFLAVAYLLERLKVHLALLRALTRTDNDTGALNLRGFREEAQSRLMLADRYAHPVALGRIDIEGFNTLIDTQGRMEGIRVLKTVAGIIGQCVRVTDIVGRLGGDEFIVLLPETDYPGAEKMFRRIHDALDRHAAEGEWPISFNISVAAYKNAPATVDEALQYVDRIMHRLKKMGKIDILYEQQAGANRHAYHER